MINIDQFIVDLQNLGVNLWVENESLFYQAPKDTLTPNLLSQLRDRKMEVVELLKSLSDSSDNIIPIVDRTQRIPLSFAQYRLWFLDQLQGSSPAYNMCRALSLQGYLDIEVLQKALSTITARHETLRTNFVTENGIPKQVIATVTPIEISVIDLKHLPADEQTSKVHEFIEEELVRHFNLASERLFRISLIKLSERVHILVFVMHHIISDGWSLRVLQQELFTLYTAFSQDRPSPLPNLPIQYADFSQWQSNWFCGKVLANHLNYWKEQLKDIPLALELPTDKPRPKVQTFSGKSQKSYLPLKLSQKIKSLSQRSGATLFMTLLASFGVLLFRYSHQADLVIGSPIANRNRLEIEPLIGFFVNTLALRVNLQNNPSFKELLNRVKGMCLDAYSYQDLPFEKLVEELQPERSLSHHPLFQVMFSLNNMPRSPLDLPNLHVEYLEVASQTAKFDLTLVMSDTPDGLICKWEYNTDLFEDATIERMSKHYQVLLENIVANPDQKISELPILTESEKQQLLEEWNHTKFISTELKCIHQLFEQQAEQTPDQIAVTFAGQALTYQELNDQANQLANYLCSLGVTSETLVGIFVNRSLEMVVAILGILKAGGAYVPLDVNYPQERLSFLLSDTKLSVLLTQQSLILRLPSPKPDHVLQIVRLDADWQQIAVTQVQGNPSSAVALHNLAYVIYTSGSTGKPKGVQISHASVANLLAAMQDQLKIAAQDKLLAVTNTSFDISVLEIFLPLITGARVILMPAEAAYDAQQLLAQLQDAPLTERPTIMQATPATWQLLLQAGWTGSSNFKVLCGGEALSLELARQLRDHCDAVWNLYGPTETTIWTTSARIQPETNRITIGKPLANYQVYILDEFLQPVPIGVTGELYIGGAGMARGYLNQPNLTAEKFINYSFNNHPDIRLYKTGDLVRYLPDGNVEFLGRKDYQVKLRGFRIELGEVEASLRQYNAIQDCAVIVREDQPNDKRLVAYLVTTAQQLNSSIFIDELKSFLKQKLPNFMIPSALVLLEALPLNSNGKLNRNALPVPEQSQSITHFNYIAPRTEIEQILVNIWQRVLSLYSPISIHDNFFDLGGHSLLSVQLVAEIEAAFQQKVGLTTVFQLTTIAEMAQLIEEMGTPQSLKIDTPLPIEIYRYLFAYTAGWPVKRLRPHSLMFGLNCDGTKPPLFWCFQDFAEFYQVAHHLGREQPVYAMRSLYLIANYTTENIEALADHYINEILETQPEGDYLIGGVCQGSQIALAIAQQLISRGKTVKLLCLHEFYKPISYPSKIALFFAQNSTLYKKHRFGLSNVNLSKLYPAGFSVNIISGTHNNFLVEPHIQDFANKLKAAIEQVHYRNLPAKSSLQEHQVKVRGTVVDLHDIEAVLAQHQAVQQCVVISETDSLGRHQRFVAYIITVDEVPSNQEFQDFMRQHLPEHLVPSAFIQLPALPLDPDGKVLRQELSLLLKNS